MQIRFGCHICGQDLSAPDTESEIRCPKCKRTIMVPIRSTLPSPVPDFSPQHQHRAENVQRALVKRAKVRPSKMFQKIAVIGAIALGACFVYAAYIAPRPGSSAGADIHNCSAKVPDHVSASVSAVSRFLAAASSSSYRATSRKYASATEATSNPCPLPTSILDEIETAAHRI